MGQPHQAAAAHPPLASRRAAAIKMIQKPEFSSSAWRPNALMWSWTAEVEKV